MTDWLTAEEIQGKQKQAIQHTDYETSQAMCGEILALVEARAKEHALRVYGPKQEV